MRQSRRVWVLLLEAAVATVLVTGVILVWGVAPEEFRGAILLVSGVIVAVVYVILYAIQRQGHWRV